MSNKGVQTSSTLSTPELYKSIACSSGNLDAVWRESCTSDNPNMIKKRSHTVSMLYIPDLCAAILRSCKHRDVANRGEHGHKHRVAMTMQHLQAFTRFRTPHSGSPVS
mmetsp:Transcript_11432/g.19574  ORF Transcript_11432/g.19574 Transcript_11432/m.19574 type:complete len:108 (-) Transcript_11432:214-537(-)